MHFLPGHLPPKQIPSLHLLLEVPPCPFHLRRCYDYTQQCVFYISLICLISPVPENGTNGGDTKSTQTFSKQIQPTRRDCTECETKGLSVITFYREMEQTAQPYGPRNQV